MRKRLLLLLGLVVCLLVGLVGFLWVAGRDHRIDWESWANIKKGMTLQEVEELIGESGNYRTRKRMSRFFLVDSFGYDAGEQTLSWQGDNACFVVSFDAQTKVCRAICFCDPTQTYDGFLNKCRRWLGLPCTKPCYVQPG